MDGHPPLPALLSRCFVAFTVELDNEFEHRMPHRTSNGGAAPGGPWLTSYAIWSTAMRFLGPDGLRADELETRSGLRTNLAGLQRWGYVTVGPAPDDSRPKPPAGDLVIRPTAAGQAARELWSVLPGEIEERWRERFGPEAVECLHAALTEVSGQLDPGLPDALPILGYGLWTRDGVTPVKPELREPSLIREISRVLLAFALDVERDSDVSIAVGADVLPALGAAPVLVRDLPRRTGVSKEAIAMALGLLGKRGLAVVEAAPAGSRGKAARLTGPGLTVRDDVARGLVAVEQLWHDRFGAEPIAALREALTAVAEPESRLIDGMTPYPDGWRHNVRTPPTLPNFPMVLHRGGYPDGS